MKTVWILLGSIAVLKAATGPPVEPESGYRVQLSATFPRVVYVAVNAPADFVPKEEPVIVEAGFGNVRDQKMADAFHASWERARPAGMGNGKALAVRIRVDDDIRRAGTYNVVVNLQPLSQPQAGRWKLEIIQPAAQLEALPLSITRLRWTPSPFQEPLPKLMVREGSGDVRLTLTSVEQWDTTPGKGRIQIIDSKLPEIPAGQGLEPAHAIAYELADFPPGKVTHTLRFHAPQLTAPAGVTVEVETRWPRLYLWFAIVAGLLAGYFAKVTLRDRIELEQAKLQADELLSQAASDRARIHDEPFRQTLDQPILNLRAARDGTKREAIKTRHGELADALKSASAGHDLRMQNEQKARDQLRAVLGQDWNVSPGALAAVQAARQGLADVEARFREFDADGAGTRMAHIRHDLAGRIRPVYAGWSTVVHTVELMASALAGLPTRVVAQASEALRNAPQDWRHVQHLADDPAVEAISSALSDYETKLRFVDDLLDSLVLRLELEWEEIANLLAPVAGHFPDAAAMEALQLDWDGLLQILRQGAQPAAGAIDITGARLRQLQQLWFQFFTRQMRDAEMETHVADREFAKAAARLAAALPAPAGRVVLGSRGAAAAVPRQIDWAAIAAWGRTRFGFVPGFGAVASLAPYVKPFALPPAEAIRMAQWIQTVIVGLILTVSLLAGITSNQGLLTDLFNAFTIAFAADVTLDALLTRLRPKP